MGNVRNMMRYLRIVFGFIFGLLIMTATETAQAADLENTLYMELKTGRVVITLRPDIAPNHVARIKELAREEFYDGLLFHRVIEGFMAQTGDIEYGNKKDFNGGRVGTGGSDLPDLKEEFNDTKHVKGTCSMARAASPNSANSQFFICLDGAGNLDGKYTIWGQVIQGMNHVDKIKKGSPLNNGSVTDPDTMKRVTVGSGKTGEKSL